jgi:hypothetical protein
MRKLQERMYAQTVALRDRNGMPLNGGALVSRIADCMRVLRQLA